MIRMKWISKLPPEYIWPGDVWEKETDHSFWYPDISCKVWRMESDPLLFVDFPKKTKVMLS